MARTRGMVGAHPGASDLALAIAFTIAALVSVASIYGEIEDSDPSFHKPSELAVVLCMCALTLPLAWRRRFPFSVAVVVVAAFVVGRVVVEVPESSMTLLAGSVALYSAAAHGRPRFRDFILTVCLGAILIEVARELFVVEPPGLRPLTQAFLFAYNAAVLALPWILGVAIRSLRDRQQEVAERAAELAREREENARQAVFAERVRIARELHDVVAHHVSVMGIQAGAARRVMQRDPDKAVEALSSIEASSRQAVVELHRILGYMRRAGEAEDLAPQPRLEDLADLVAQASAGNLTLRLEILGGVRPLPPTLEVSAYRVIQEAITNARKHSGASTVTVRVNYTPVALLVEVLDDGTGLSMAGNHKPGHGLIGMRERTVLHGGHLRVGPLPEGGFAVHATFPIDGSPA